MRMENSSTNLKIQTLTQHYRPCSHFLAYKSNFYDMIETILIHPPCYLIKVFVFLNCGCLSQFVLDF